MKIRLLFVFFACMLGTAVNIQAILPQKYKELLEAFDKAIASNNTGEAKKKLQEIKDAWGIDQTARHPLPQRIVAVFYPGQEINKSDYDAFMKKMLAEKQGQIAKLSSASVITVAPAAAPVVPATRPASSTVSVAPTAVSQPLPAPAVIPPVPVTPIVVQTPILIQPPQPAPLPSATLSAPTVTEQPLPESVVITAEPTSAAPVIQAPTPAQPVIQQHPRTEEEEKKRYQSIVQQAAVQQIKPLKANASFNDTKQWLDMFEGVVNKALDSSMQDDEVQDQIIKLFDQNVPSFQQIVIDLEKKSDKDQIELFNKINTLIYSLLGDPDRPDCNEEVGRRAEEIKNKIITNQKVKQSLEKIKNKFQGGVEVIHSFHIPQINHRELLIQTKSIPNPQLIKNIHQEMQEWAKSVDNIRRAVTFINRTYANC